MQENVFIAPQLENNVVLNALNELVLNMLSFLPKLIVALIIWYIGRYILKLAINLIRKLDLPGTTVEDEAINTIVGVTSVLGRITLILIILDYLGIGRTVVSAIANGLTFAVAISLGLAFGKALEPDAAAIVKTFRKLIHQEDK